MWEGNLRFLGTRLIVHFILWICLDVLRLILLDVRFYNGHFTILSLKISKWMIVSKRRFVVFYDRRKAEFTMNFDFGVVLCLTLQIFKQIKHLTSCRRPNFWRTSIRRHWTPWKKQRTNDCGLRRIRNWENCISIERIGRDCRRFWSNCTAPVRWRLLSFWSHLLPFANVWNVKPFRNACRIRLLWAFWLPSLWIAIFSNEATVMKSTSSSTRKFCVILNCLFTTF